MSLFRKNILATYAAQIVMVICNFLCAILAARMLGAGGQGSLALYVSFTAFVLLFVGVGLPSAVVHYIASNKILKSKIFPIILSVTLMMVVGFSLFLYLSSFTNSIEIFLPLFILQNKIWFAILIFHVLLMMLNQYLSSILQAENHFILASIITTIGSMLLLILYSAKYFSLIAVNVLPLHFIIFSMLMVSGILYFLYLTFIYKKEKQYFSFHTFSFEEIKPMILFSGFAFVANLVQFLSYKMDLWFVNFYYHSKEMIGVYALSVSLAQLVWMLPSAVHSVLFTFNSSAEYSLVEKYHKSKKTSNLILLYAIIAAIIGYFLSVYLVPIWFGLEFEDASKLIGILLFGIVPFCYGMGISAYFAGVGKVKYNMIGSIVGMIICAIFDMILIPKYGIMGAAIASVISYLSTVLVYFVLFIREKKIISL